MKGEMLMATSNPDYYEMVLAEHEAELAKNISYLVHKGLVFEILILDLS